MKLALLPVVFILLLLPVVGAQTTSDIDIVLLRQSPLPAEPGSNVNVEIEIQNSGNGGAEDVIVEINPQSPFTLLQGEKRKMTFSSIGGGKSAKTSFLLNVDENAISNSYKLEFLMSESGSIGFSYPVLVKVEGVPKLVLLSITPTPEIIEPGANVELAFEFQNIGTGEARQVEFELGRNESVIPTLSGGNVYLGNIGAGEKKIGIAAVSIDPSAEYRTYSTTLKTTYKDENSTEITNEQTIGIPVRGTILLDIINSEPSFTSEVFKIEVANKGTTEAKSVEAKLYKGDTLIGVDYTSQIKASKQSTFNFPLVSEGGMGRLEISYIGPGIEKNTITKDVSLDLNLPASDGTGIGIVIIILVVVVGYWYYRRRKKKRRRAKK